jgi:hypothetical protein
LDGGNNEAWESRGRRDAYSGLVCGLTKEKKIDLKACLSYQIILSGRQQYLMK